MFVLLPPSEGKRAASRGKALDLAELSAPELNPAREKVLDALTGMSPDEARAALGLSAGQDGEIARNAALRTAPAAPAAKVYSGVLYEAFDPATLTAAAKRYANRRVLVYSALWGVVRLGDRIPAYRCSAGVRLPGVGGLTAFWRKQDLAPPPGLVLDLRSTGYAAMWPPDGRTVTVRILHERDVNGVPQRSVVSHFNKATKGRLVRTLATRNVLPRNRKQLVEALRDLGYTVEETDAGVDLVVTEI
ncbi:UPF0246 protein [Virgisporangium aliadipatigenens]|uniref:UPF0246 protein n=1 Tax=Virgisporangium aliadipatigenens TaxID=741659 RepID=A0A8J3YS77_9ACTN|nr:peroxide stress protein YaaA [Virgisporangium aliadipatigenens]GIJ48990.1 UPF0246 protein [Virgisporangium aliadipatigenens]